MLFNRLSKRLRHLKKWARRIGINAFRLYDRDIPEIPLVLDLYDDSVSGAIYKKPAELWPCEKGDETEVAGILLKTMKAAVGQALGISENRIFLKERRRMRARQETGNQYGKIGGKSFYRDVHEGGSHFQGKPCELPGHRALS